MIHKHILRVIVALCCTILIYGCDSGKSVAKSADFVGTYSVKYEPYHGTVLGNETLVLRADHTFEQTFQPINGSLKRNKGAWTLDSNPDGTQVIYLKGLMLYLEDWNDKLRKVPQRTGVFSEFRVYKNGSVAIVIDSDLDMYYRKK